VVGGELTEKRVAFVVANDGIEEAELVQPWTAWSTRGPGRKWWPSRLAWPGHCAT
jgi:hypothetical protein